METQTANATMPGVGDPAPAFELPDDTGTIRRLSDARGRWLVLYFYPEDDTSGCTAEACEFRDAEEPIRTADAVVWGVSPQGIESKARFKRKYDLNFPLLADEDHAVAEAYGAWQLKNNYGRTYWGVVRSTFLIDPDGRVAQVWRKVKPQGHAAQVLEAIEGARAAGP